MPAGVKLKSEKVTIDLSDDDDGDDVVGCTYQRLHREIAQTIGENEHPQRAETIKRKQASDIYISSSSSDEGLVQIPLKKNKTTPASSNIHSLPG